MSEANPHRVSCAFCDSDKLWFDVIDTPELMHVVHCMDCGAEYLQ